MGTARTAPGRGDMITIALVDDQELVRTGFRLILEAEADFEITGEAADGDAALALIARTRPDVVLMDVRMPGMDGIEATRRVTPPTRVLVLTTFDLDEVVWEAIRAGAAGFLLKTAPADDLVRAAPGRRRRGDSLFLPVDHAQADRDVRCAAAGVSPPMSAS